jgi:hypothetical protein
MSAKPVVKTSSMTPAMQEYAIYAAQVNLSFILRLCGEKGYYFRNDDIDCSYDHLGCLGQVYDRTRNRISYKKSI